MPKISFHWYGLIVGLAIVVCYDLIKKLAETEKLKKIVDEAFLPVVLAGLIGARLYHVFDQFEYYYQNPLAVFYLGQGGLGIFGALIGGLVALVAYLHLTHNLAMLPKLLSILVTVVPLGQAVGRFGNFINKELYGTTSDLPWALKDSYGVARHPLFFYEMFLNLILFGFLITKKDRSQNVSYYLIGYGLIRLFLEFFRQPSDTWIYFDFSVARIISVAMIIVGVIMLYKNALKINNLQSSEQ